MRRGTGSLAILLTCVHIATGQQATAPRDRESNLQSFETVWKTVKDHYWDPQMSGIDWQAIHDEFRPKIEGAKSREEARTLIGDMLARLKQTHFGVVPSDVYRELDPSGDESVGEATPGIDLRVLDGHAVVTTVDAKSPAAERGVKPGWQIVNINGSAIDPAIQSIREQFATSTLQDFRLTRSVLARLQGASGERVKVDFLNQNDQPVELDLARVEPRGKVVHMGNMPANHFWSEWRKVGSGIGYVRFNEFMEPDALIKTFQESVGACRDCKGFVIDLRGNPGGIGGLAMGVAGWFVDQAGLQLGTEYLRGIGPIKFVIYPRAEPFRGPLAILVDGCSASTAEIFAGGLKDVKRARIFGTRTAGAALPSVISKLPNGDGFQYAIANYISQGGQPLEGIGVTPDEEIRPTRRELLAGKDPALDAAVNWIQKK